MSSKKSNVEAICLRLTPLDYHLMAIASTYYLDSDGKHVTRAQFCRESIKGVSSVLLKGAGVLEKTINDWNTSLAGREILESRKKKDVMEGDDLP